MFGGGRSSPLPTTKQRLSRSNFPTFGSRLTIPPPVAPFIRNRLFLSLAAGVLTLFLLFSSASPFSRSHPSPATSFPSRGLKKTLWTRLNAIPWREFTLEPNEIPWRSLSSPDDPVPWTSTDLFPTSFDTPNGLVSLSSPPKHKIDVYPRHLVLPPTAPSLDKLIFGIVTTIDRAKMMAPVWTHWLTPQHEDGLESEEDRPACLVLTSAEEMDEAREELRKVLKRNRLNCAVKASQHERYEVRVLSMTVELRDYAAELGRTFDWYIFGDDDTFWLDQRMLRRMLSKYDPREDYLVGAVSEAKHQLESFGRMAFGGAGLSISDALGAKLYNLWDTCWTNWKHIFGGDEMITRCAALATSTTKQTVTTLEPGLHQFDIPGDTTGVLQGGIPLLNLHHFIGGSWVHLLGYGSYRSDLSQILLFKRVLDFIGGDNMFRRYVFGDGYWLLTQGYSLTLFEEPLTPQQLRKVEHTWYEGYQLTLQDRPPIPERHERNSTVKVKQTFYIDDINVLSPSSAIITYVMADKWDEHLSSAERVRYEVYWDGCWTGRGPGCSSSAIREPRAVEEVTASHTIKIDVIPSGEKTKTAKPARTDVAR